MMGRSATLALAWAWMLLPAPPTNAATLCGTSGGTTLQTLSIATQGDHRVTRTITLPSGTEVSLTATEKGVDVRLEIQQGEEIRAWDNPVRRWGPQRFVLPAGAQRRVTVSVVTKEGVQGTLQLAVVALSPSGPANACMKAVHLLADGDASFTRGQLISLGAATASGNSQQEYASAAASYQSAAAIAKSHGANALLAQAYLSAAAVLYQGVQNWAEALRVAELAIDAYQLAGDEYGVDRARAMAAAAEMEVALDVADATKSGDQSAAQRSARMLEHARQTLRAVAASHTQRAEFYDQALALNNIGLAFYYEGTYDPAIQAYKHAHALFERLGEKKRQAQTLQNLAVVQQQLAQFANARTVYAMVLKLLNESADPRLYADVLNNLAMMEAETGEVDAALRHFSDALGIFTRIQSVREQARSLQGIGNVYNVIGNRSEALGYFDRALALRSAALDPRGRTDTLRSSADILRSFGRWTEAIARREEALVLAQSPALRGRILVELAGDSSARGDNAAALARAEEALTADPGDHVVHARVLALRAAIHLSNKSYESAEQDAAEASRTFRSYEMLTSTFETLLLQARIACGRADRPAAMRFVDEALSLTEWLRRASSSPALRITLWQSLRPAFELKITMITAPQTCGGGGSTEQTSEDRAAEALEVAEQSRNRALADYRELAQTVERSHAGNGPEGKRQKLFEDLASHRMQIETLAQSNSQDNPALRALQQEVTALKRDIDILDGEIAAASLGRTKAPEAPVKRLRAGIETISPGAAVIEYWLGNDTTYAWLATQHRVLMFDLGPTSRITLTALKLHDSLQRAASVPASERTLLARELYALIFAPLREEVRESRALYFVPDGALHYVPFAVLAQTAEPTKYLIEDHDIAVIPSVLFTQPHTEPLPVTTTPSVLIVSDPVYARSDARFSHGDSALFAATTRNADTKLTLRGSADNKELKRLPGSAREAAIITSLFPPGSVDTLSGFDATREELLKRDLSRYRILHIATHGVADIEAPQLSLLTLSTYDRSGSSIPSEVFAGDLLLRRLNADLVVLSACDSSLGPQTAGEGLFGLRYAAHASGARSVVASLWPVADVIGPQIMGDFYTRLAHGRESPTAALSDAMRAARAKWPDPALWGVFEVSRVTRETVLH